MVRSLGKYFHEGYPCIPFRDIDESCNFIGWEDFGIYLRKENSPKHGVFKGKQRIFKGQIEQRSFILGYFQQLANQNFSGKSTSFTFFCKKYIYCCAKFLKKKTNKKIPRTRGEGGGGWGWGKMSPMFKPR